MKQAFLPQVRAGVFIPFVRFLEAVGLPVDRYLVDAKISPHVVEFPENLMPLCQAMSFIDRAAHAEGIEHIGVLVGERSDVANLGTLGRITAQSPTLNSALTSLVANFHHYNSGARMGLLQDRSQFYLCHELASDDWEGGRHGNLLAIMLMIKIIRLAAGPTWWPREIRLPKVEMKWHRDYAVFLQANTVFHDDRFYAVAVDRANLVQSLMAAEKRRDLRSGDSEFLRSTAPAYDLLESIRQAVGGLLSAGYPDVRLVAELSGMSVRSFQRCLSGRGTSYSRLVEQVRFERAETMVSDGHASMIDIAYDLGYTDAANFARAFRHWTGVSPRKYRSLANSGALSPMPNTG